MEEILNQWIDSHREELIRAVQELVQIPSVNGPEQKGMPFGQPIQEALERILEMGRCMGFEVKRYDGYAGAIRYGEGDSEIGILSHMDVVPAGDPEGWTYPPFEGRIVDDRLYGRGSLDDKGPMAAALFAMKAVAASGLPLKQRLCHIIGTDEETRHRGLKYYLQKEKAPSAGFSPDGNFPVIHGEKSILRFTIEEGWCIRRNGEITLESLEGGTVPNAVPGSARMVLRCGKEGRDAVLAAYDAFEDRGSLGIEERDGRMIVSAKGAGAHAMQPWVGRNAIHRLLRFASGLELEPAEARDYLRALVQLFCGGWDGSGTGIACEDQLSGKLTLNFGVIRLDRQGGRAVFDMRIPIHADPDVIWSTLWMACAKEQLTAKILEKKNALYIPGNAPLVQTLLRVYEECTGEAAEPIVIGGGTYCRDVENFVSFGPLFPGEKELAHEQDEYIEIERLIQCAKIYAQAMYALAK